MFCQNVLKEFAGIVLGNCWRIMMVAITFAGISNHYWVLPTGVQFWFGSVLLT